MFFYVFSLSSGTNVPTNNAPSFLPSLPPPSPSLQLSTRYRYMKINSVKKVENYTFQCYQLLKSRKNPFFATKNFKIKSKGEMKTFQSFIH